MCNKNMVTSIPFLRARVADENDFLKLKEMSKNQDNWNLDYERTDIKIWSKSVPDSTIRMVKVWTVYSGINSKDMYYTLMDNIYRKEWDTHMVVGYEIGHLNTNNAITYYGASCPPLKKRDFVLQNSWLDKGSEYFVINHSVCHKDHPPRPGFIRAISYFTGYFIKTIPNGCEVCFVSQTDPQGIVPSWIINKCTQIFAPRFVKVLGSAAFGYNTWKIQNNPHYFPWVYPEQIKCPKISLADCVPSEEEKQSSFYRYLEEKVRKHNLKIQMSESLSGKVHSNITIGESSKIFSEKNPSNGNYQQVKETHSKERKKNGRRTKS